MEKDRKKGWEKGVKLDSVIDSKDQADVPLAILLVGEHWCQTFALPQLKFAFSIWIGKGLRNHMSVGNGAKRWGQAGGIKSTFLRRRGLSCNLIPSECASILFSWYVQCHCHPDCRL